MHQLIGGHASGRSPLDPGVARAAWRRLPWRARLLLLLHRRWPGLARLPLLVRWFAWAGVRLITEVALAQKHQPESNLPGCRPALDDSVEAPGDRLILRTILVVGIAVIIVRHIGYLITSIGALALLIPFLLWPPWWPLIRQLFDVARRDQELRQRWEDEVVRRDLEDDRDDPRGV